MNTRRQVRVSERAYYMLKAKSKASKYRGRGVIGVVDDVLFGEFSTTGSGRPGKKRRSNNQKNS